MTAGGQRDAVVAVLVHAGRVLVIQRGPAVSRAGFWAPPSGRVEPGESQPGALVREMREELGLAVVPLAKVWECNTDDGSYRLHWWTGQVTHPRLAPDPDEIADARWIEPARFGELTPTFADDRWFFHQILPTLGLVS